MRATRIMACTIAISLFITTAAIAKVLYVDKDLIIRKRTVFSGTLVFGTDTVLFGADTVIFGGG